MKPLSITISAVLALLISPSVHADGNTLLEQCLVTERYLDTKEMSNPFNVGMCIGIIQGVRYTMQIKNDGAIKICLPEQIITNGQAVRIVTSYLKRNPASLHINEVALIMSAFIEAFPCK